jgi:hypothetical protein
MVNNAVSKELPLPPSQGNLSPSDYHVSSAAPKFWQPHKKDDREGERVVTRRPITNYELIPTGNITARLIIR